MTPAAAKSPRAKATPVSLAVNSSLPTVPELEDPRVGVVAMRALDSASPHRDEKKSEVMVAVVNGSDHVTGGGVDEVGDFLGRMLMSDVCFDRRFFRPASDPAAPLPCGATEPSPQHGAPHPDLHCFQSAALPSMDITAYLKRLLSHDGLSRDVAIAAVVEIYWLWRFTPKFWLTAFTIHRLVAASFGVALAARGRLNTRLRAPVVGVPADELEDLVATYQRLITKINTPHR